MVVANEAEYGGGGAYCLYGGTVTHCALMRNATAGDGGGVGCSQGGLVANCLVTLNTAAGDGGGVDSHQGQLVNCTVVTNTAGEKGGGIAATDATNLNCIIYFNTAIEAGSDWHTNEEGNVFAFCCAYPTSGIPGGEWCIEDDPQFMDVPGEDYRLGPSSPCIEAGNNAYKVGDTDLDGRPRILGLFVDLGAHESAWPYIAVTGPIPFYVSYSSDACDIAGTNNDHVAGGWWTNLTAGGQGELTVSWEGWSGSAGGLQVGPNTIEVYGTNQWGESDSDSITIIRAAEVHYVATNGGHVSPYTNWVHAATNIQDAVDAALEWHSALVLVSNGVYNTGGRPAPGHALTNRVCISGPVTVQSVGQPECTLIVGSEAGMGAPAMRCAYLTNGAVLAGFTLTNGYASGTGKDPYGGGAFLDSGGMISNCALVGNLANGNGGGAYLDHGGSLSDCHLINNSVVDPCWGGGAFCAGGGTLERCLIADGQAARGGGVYLDGGGAVTHSVVYNNGVATFMGPGIGGGIYADGGTVDNCLIVGNSAVGGAAGVYCEQSTVAGCTIVSNSATSVAGGVYCLDGTNYNCIIYSNTASQAGDNWRTNGASFFAFCCTYPTNDLPGHETCIEDDPQLVDVPGGNYRLSFGSPCINAGWNEVVETAFDLDGRARIIQGRVDMGAYESAWPLIAVTSPAPSYVSHSSDTCLIAGTNDELVAGALWWTNLTASTRDDATRDTGSTWTGTVTGLLVGPNAVLICGTNQWGEIGCDSLTIYRAAEAHYVATNGGHVSPFVTWANAATQIQEAVDVALECRSPLVLVSNGVYNTGGRAAPGYLLTNRVCITNALEVRGEGDRDQTLIVGQPHPGDVDGLGFAAVRCAYIVEGVSLFGLTLTNGYTSGAGGGVEAWGGGAYMDAGGLVSNCVFVGNSAFYGGGGVYCESGLVVNCLISANNSFEWNLGARGGGVSCQSGGTIANCSISAIRAGRAAGRTAGRGRWSIAPSSATRPASMAAESVATAAARSGIVRFPGISPKMAAASCASEV